MSELRVPGEEDIATIVHMRSRHAPEPFTEERLRREWTEPGFDVERDARVSAGGYAAVEALDDSRTWIELHGEQAERALDWALERASSSRILSGCWDSDGAVRRAFDAAGFRPVRNSYRMAIDLDRVPPPPSLPAGIELRSFRSGDTQAVYEAHMETFEDSWEHVRQPYEEWAHWFLARPGFDPELWLLATARERIAGIALCRVHDGDSEIGVVTILGVRRPWRRQGLGRALLLESFHRLAARGCRRATLGVDASSLTGADRLYENAGMRVVSTFAIYERTA